LVRVDEAQFLERIDTCDDVAPRTVTGIVPDGALVGVAQIIAPGNSARTPRTRERP